MAHDLRAPLRAMQGYLKKATERMGGTVGYVSEAGKGSRFWVELKKAPAH